GRIVMFGGYLGAIPGVPAADTWQYDGVAWVQAMPAASPPAMQGHVLAYDSWRGRSVLFGTSTDDDIWEYDGATWTRIQSARHPTLRSSSALAFDAERGVAVL